MNINVKEKLSYIKGNILNYDLTTASGFCRHCGTIHKLKAGDSYQHALKLLKMMENNRSIDLATQVAHRDPKLTTDYLYGEARGKMFGVLECADGNGKITFIHAFSGQYDGRWLVNGWAKPLFDVDKWQSINSPAEKEIKELSRRIEQSNRSSDIQQLKRIRKQLSRELMKKLHKLYRVVNFCGETTDLPSLFPANKIPTGTGDCCGPKLLNHAAQNNLRPLSMVEFYVGRTNRSSTKKHGQFYSACREKCEPLMGFILCGLNT